MEIERTEMKRQRTMRPVAALAAAAGAVVLAAVGPLAGTAVAAAPAQGNNNNEGNHHPRLQIGYICDLTEENYLDEIGTVLGYDECEPVNGAPFQGEIKRPFFIADEDDDDLYRCRYGIAQVTDSVLGYRCTETESVF
jgi:hypothetical protein